MSAIVTVEFVVPVGYLEGDYAKLYGNNGSGDIDYDTPLNNDIFPLFPNGAGIFGFGHAPFGHFRFGHGHSMRAAGFGHLPFGHFPFGHGSDYIRAKHKIYTCGRYKYAFVCYDEFDNQHTGTPEEVELEIHIAPPVPTGLKKNSYDKDTDILILDVAA